MNPPFKKVLIANRGEIALRILRTCRDLGISVVAVYSEADRTSRHVRMADEAYPIGGSAPQESYLCIERIIDAAKRSGAEAIHPGYGFLAENPALPEACEHAGIVFVGPSSTTLRQIGEKTSARTIATSAGVPIVPGTTAPAQSLPELHSAARKVGYPVLLKACAGGGGNGMRRVDAEKELADAYRAASSEAQTAFGDGSVYVEKLIERPRHVEVQFLADAAGRIVCLGERDCSIQRRHQKLIEETPSPAVGPELRSALFTATTRAVEAVNYLNAGTAEFLLDGAGNFYFLEVNARLQVEHPVTEEATGIDLVRQQLLIAAGERLPLAEELLPVRGRAAIECRIYAEDPCNQFLPSVGRISVLQHPSGHGVRLESASYPGMQVGLHYDSLLAKLITYGATREDAVRRMRRALQEYVVLGVKTSIPFHRFTMEDDHFIRGEYDTGFVDRWYGREADHEETLTLAAVAAAALTATRQPTRLPSSPQTLTRGSAWRAVGRRDLMR